MIDWLEILWKAAEAGPEFDLPEEPDLLPAKRRTRRGTEKDEVAAPAEFFAEETEPEIPARRIPGIDQGQLGIAEMQKTAEMWNALLPDAVGASVRRFLRAGDSPENKNSVERIYRKTADSALAALYHRVREAVSPGQPGIPGRGGTVVVREEVPTAPGLTEEGLDRSLRRDSRRYDGGMSIY